MVLTLILLKQQALSKLGSFLGCYRSDAKEELKARTFCRATHGDSHLQYLKSTIHTMGPYYGPLIWNPCIPTDPLQRVQLSAGVPAVAALEHSKHFIREGDRCSPPYSRPQIVGIWAWDDS